MSSTSKSVRRRPGRIAWLKLMLDFGLRRGSSAKERARLFYYSGLKPSLVFRGWSTYSSQRILRFSTRMADHRTFLVHARDNALDISTFVEFFSARYVFIPPELPPIDPEVIYDIGANIGIASLYLADRYPNARLYAFEPVPVNFKLCQLNCQNLPRAQAFPWAVGSRSGAAAFSFSENDLRGGRLQGVETPPHERIEKQIQVPVFSIADLVSQQHLAPPDLVKIDVEGSELDVLKGMGEQVRCVRRMLVETHGPDVDAACRQWLHDHGFLILHSHEMCPGWASIWCDRI
jgi:FkbM family methyltransferase